jgi:beta-glucosidase
VIANVNVTLAWELGNVEPHVDALTLGFDTYTSAVLDVMEGRVNPVGKLPITMPKGDEVLKVNAEGVCISPNDVPGYDKDLYMPDAMKDENGKAYAYRDAAGNYYELNFGLSYC